MMSSFYNPVYLRTVQWLDDPHRQPVVSFTSRIPSALPIADASSLHPSLDTFNPFEPMLVDLLRKEVGKDAELLLSGRMLEMKISATIHLLTHHENGSLNLWHVAVDESSSFTCILCVTHKSRMCGHRFQIDQVVPHPALPLLLTTSQFQPEQSDFGNVSIALCLFSHSFKKQNLFRSVLHIIFENQTPGHFTISRYI
ncbi:unnamed protein product [Haemonchus placei]|uniref:SWIM-type domain-containing protein n=1 Tax=Haemonchus placei TaxID=6290 RepID=A0A0N4X9T3_HAEPC|nr:unnamed protein product [Haemonchus placei]